MFKALKALLAPKVNKSKASPLELESATAALMIMLATADNHFDELERQTIISLIRNRSHLQKVELEALIEEAELAATNATSIYEFSQQLNTALAYEERVKVVKDMWEVAFADGVIDKYEEYLIRRVCDLMYVSHSDFIQSRNAVRDRR